MFCKLSGEYIREGYTQIDNTFLLRYLPTADGTDIKVYLYGLTLASLREKEENSLERVALALRVTEQRVLDAFKAWENLGLVALSKTLPVSVTYLSVKNPASHRVKYDAKELSIFSEEVARLFPDKIMFQNDATNYFDFIRNYKIDVNALLLIIEYCLEQGKSSTPYILAVAADWVKQGLINEKQVAEHIQKIENNTEEVKSVLSALGVKRDSEFEDRQYLQKWNDMGYRLDGILVACKALKKKGGMAKLDAYMTELQKASAFTAEEIAVYTENKLRTRELTLRIITTLGGYYSNLDLVIETYVVPWQAKGFTGAALEKVAYYCFLRGIKTLDGMNQMLNRFFKLSLLDEKAISNFIDRQIAVDEKITAVFERCSHQGIIGQRDREFYRSWADEWGFDDDVILYVASLADKNPYPMQRINKQLALCKSNGTQSLEAVKAFLGTAPAAGTSDGKNYSETELKTVLKNFDDWDW